MNNIIDTETYLPAKHLTGSRTITACQVCGNTDLHSIMFLGYMPPVNQMPASDSDLTQQAAYPTELLLCKNCNLVQLGFILQQKLLFPLEYPYRTGTTKILRDNFANLYLEAANLIALDRDSLVIDIGSNDGTLLSNFAANHRVLGVEPTDVGELAKANNIETIRDYFSKNIAEDILTTHGKAKIITAANVFAHIENVHNIMAGIKLLLAEDGVFISESHYLIDLINKLQYDTIYHEHLRYYSLNSLQYLFNQHELEIFHVQKIPTHGGSVRVYAARIGQYSISAECGQLMSQEPVGDNLLAKLTAFKQQVILSKLQLHKLFSEIKANNARIFGISAPSRASTLINYVGVDDGILDCVVEIAGSLKIGKYMPGTIIPVVDERRLYEEQPEYALLLSWHIADELIHNLRRRGYKGKFIIPLKEVRVV
jgi:hypothetical protein